MNILSYTSSSSLAAAGDGGAMAGLIVVWLVLWIGIGGGVGYLIGNGKGRGAAGFWLGLVLGLIGWVIAAVLSPSYEHRVRSYEADAYARREADARIQHRTPGGRPLPPPTRR